MNEDRGQSSDGKGSGERGMRRVWAGKGRKQLPKEPLKPFPGLQLPQGMMRPLINIPRTPKTGLVLLSLFPR